MKRKLLVPMVLFMLIIPLQSCQDSKTVAELASYKDQVQSLTNQLQSLQVENKATINQHQKLIAENKRLSNEKKRLKKK